MRYLLLAAALPARRHHEPLMLDLQVGDAQPHDLTEARAGRSERHNHPSQVAAPALLLVNLPSRVGQPPDVGVGQDLLFPRVFDFDLAGYGEAVADRVAHRGRELVAVARGDEVETCASIVDDAPG